MLEERREARSKRDYATSDRLRDELRANGVHLYDSEGIWKMQDGRSGTLEAGIASGATVPASEATANEETVSVASIESLVRQREEHRTVKQWAQADAIREELASFHLSKWPFTQPIGEGKPRHTEL